MTDLKLVWLQTRTLWHLRPGLRDCPGVGLCCFPRACGRPESFAYVGYLTEGWNRGATGGGICTHRSRLTPEREGEIFAAVMRLLREHDYGRLVMQVAAASRSSAATAYRRWGGKPSSSRAALTRRLVTGVVPTEDYLVRFIDAVLIPVLGGAPTLSGPASPE